MTKQVINVGSAANDGTGDTLRAASQKINSNFTEVYVAVQAAFNAANTSGGGANLGSFKINGNTLGTTAENDGWGAYDMIFCPNGEGYSYIYIPNDTNSNDGAPIAIGNSSSTGGGIQLSVNNGSWTFNNDGSLQYPSVATNARTGSGEALVFNKSNSQKIIATKNGTVDQPTVERLVIAGGDGYRNPDTNLYTPYTEGGDIYLWAGRGADGGDIKIDAGNSYGQNGELGGDIKIRGGYSQTGQGGFVLIQAGQGANQHGGDINIEAGNGSVLGGDVTIVAGTSGTDAGKVRLTAAGTRYWDFNPDGSTVFPDNVLTPGLNNNMSLRTNNEAGYYAEIDIGPSYVDTYSWNNTLNAGAEVYINNANTDSPYVYVLVNAHDVSQRQWTFSSDGSLKFPTDGKIEPVGMGWTGLTNGTSETPVSLIAKNAAGNWRSGVTAYNNTGTSGEVEINTISSPGIPTSVNNWNGGGGWNQGSYTDLATTGGTGTGLTVDVAAGGGGYINISAISIHTPGTGYTSGDVITITNENNISGTFSIVADEINNSWYFTESGKTTIPGGIVGRVKPNTYTSTTINLDVNATINKLTPINNTDRDHYHLDDGVEGQIMYLTLASGDSTEESVMMHFDSARYTNGVGNITTGQNVSGWMPFRGAPNTTSTTITLLFIDGYWNLPHSNFI